MSRVNAMEKEAGDWAVGSIIRKRRKDLGMSLQELCNSADLSKGYLSRVECGHATPSLGTLAQIAGALDVSMQYFIAEPTAAERLSRSENRSQFSIDNSSYTYEPLSFNASGSELSSYLIHIPAHCQSEIMKHAGEEIIYILAGELLHTLGDEHIRMQQGDSLHFNGSIPHAWHNPTDEVVSVVWTGTLEILQSGILSLSEKVD